MRIIHVELLWYEPWDGGASGVRSAPYIHWGYGSCDAAAAADAVSKDGTTLASVSKHSPQGIFPTSVSQ